MTDTDNIDAQAGEYVLGTLDGAERVAFETALAEDPKLQAIVESWQRQLVGLAETEVDAAPPPGIWNAIASEIGEADPGTRTILASDDGWQVISPGAEVKLLFTDRDAGTYSYLLRVAAGAPMAKHTHAGVEECLVLEGEIDLNGATLGAGDYQVATPGSVHETLSSEKGALLYIRSAQSPLPSAA